MSRRELKLIEPTTSSSLFTVCLLTKKHLWKKSSLGFMPKYPSKRATKPEMYSKLLGVMLWSWRP